jgi:cytochrome c peroxidase
MVAQCVSWNSQEVAKAVKTQWIGFCFTLFAAVGSAQELPSPLIDASYHPVDSVEAALGQLLFYDPILSGNKTTSCASCHHPNFGTADGLSLSFGDGGVSMGLNRTFDPLNVPEDRIPRNAPALFNLGAKEFTSLFHDGRLELDPSKPDGIRTPMDADMVEGFASILSAQTMFPVLSRDEMAGSFRENDVAQLVRQGRITGPKGAWATLTKRVVDIPAYVEDLVAIYPHVSDAGDVVFADLANAIAAFIEFEWRSDTSQFDEVLRGGVQLTGLAQEGLEVFYGHGQCASCHTGAMLTDHQFHVMAAPQIGPGKSPSFQNHFRDDGRFNVTGREEDRYAFRTPSLRNVALTAPYGHAGAHRDLAAFISDHSDPARSLVNYNRDQAILPIFRGDDFVVLNDPAQVNAIAAAVTTDPVELSARHVAALVAFLETTTDPVSLSGRLGVPSSVPSGLPVVQAD